MKYSPRLFNLSDIFFKQAFTYKHLNRLLVISMLFLTYWFSEAKAQHNIIVEKLDTLTNFSKKHGGFYYRDKNILAYASRFSLDKKCELVGMNVTLRGDTGSCRVRVFGYEGGINAPVIEEDICVPLFIHKKNVGLETIYVEFKPRVPLETKQFYICVDKIASGVHIITDTVTKHQWCSSRDGEMFYYQMLKTGSDQKSQWLYSKYAFMIEPIIRFEQVPEKMFALDTNALVEDTAFTPSKKIQLPNNHSISCADINNDGFMDVLNDGRLYVNRNGTKLVEVTREIGLQGNPKANIFIDVNNDGLTDILFVGNQDSTFNNTTLFINQSGTTFKVSDIQIPSISTPNSFSVADINLDGYLDVVIGQQSSLNGKEYSPLLVLINKKDGQFVDATSTYLPINILLLECTSLTLRDIDNDGYADLYLNATTIQGVSQKYIFLNKGNKFTQLEVPTLNQESIVSAREKSNMGVCWYDIDNDGVLDLLSSERIRYSVYKQEKQHISTVYQRSRSQDITLHPLPVNPFIYTDKLSSNAWEDINNDGMPDCLLSTNCACRTADVYIQNTPLSFIENSRELGLGHLTDLRDILWLDFNNDAKVDLFCIENNTLHIYTNNTSNSNNYVNIQLKSEAGNTSIGKVVKVYSGGNIYTKDVTSGRGLLIQDSPVLHFGLGSNNKVDSIYIDERKITNIDLNRSFQSINIKPSSYNNTALSQTIDLIVQPNPFTKQLLIKFTVTDAEKPISVTIHDLYGRKVATLIDNTLEQRGQKTLYWQANNDSGNEVASGVYVVRVSSGESEIKTCITKID